jgi:hypothetical protein
MRVKCNRLISATTKEDLGEESPWLKKGNEYTVLGMRWSSKFGMRILIQTEHYNEPRFISIDGFEIINQKIPPSWKTQTSKFGDQIIVVMMPESWLNYDNFLDKLENEDSSAVALFNKEAELIYRGEGKT